MKRERLEYDVLIVGGGPAGLACAISLAQAGRKAGRAPAICLLEKAAEPGLHTISGAIIDPCPLDALTPDWRNDATFPLRTTVREEELWLLSARRRWRLPTSLLPSFLRHEGQRVGSLSALVRWLARRAEEMGVEIFPGFPAQQAIFDDSGALAGVVAGEAGLSEDGARGPRYEPGVEIVARFVVLAEGARGNISRAVRQRFAPFRHPVHHALALKELWETAREDAGLAGEVIHTLGWPLSGKAMGGGFFYRQDARHVALGLAVHMDWSNPTLSPFCELQRLKTHPSLAPLLADGQRIGYGARAIAFADAADIEALAFPGGLFVGDAFGLVNPARAQGVHPALESGRLAGLALAEALTAGEARRRIERYVSLVRQSVFWQEHAAAASFKPLWSRFGVLGLLAAGMDLHWRNLTGRGLWPALHLDRPDRAVLKPASETAPIDCPKADGALVFSRADSLALSGVSHRRDQPAHLKIRDMAALRARNLELFAGPEEHYCPGGVYVWRQGGDGKPRLLIQAENCLHCKACEIKDPGANIVWTPPEGGDGPRYRGL